MLIIFINAHTLLLGNQILQCTSYPIHFILSVSLLLMVNQVPGAASAFTCRSLLTLPAGYHSPHLTEGETEAQRVKLRLREAKVLTKSVFSIIMLY